MCKCIRTRIVSVYAGFSYAGCRVLGIRWGFLTYEGFRAWDLATLASCEFGVCACVRAGFRGSEVWGLRLRLLRASCSMASGFQGVGCFYGLRGVGLSQMRIEELRL